MPSPTLENIVQNCRKGKRSAYKQLYKHFYGYVASIAIRYGSTQEEAEEIINDAFLKVFDKIEKLYNPEYPFKPWLRKVAIHAAVDYLRKHRKGQMMLDLPEMERPMEENILDDMSANEILEIVQGLSPAYRVVFNLYSIEGYRHAEIAELLHINEGTSKSNLHKARLWLQRAIKERNCESEMKGYGSR